MRKLQAMLSQKVSDLFPILEFAIFATRAHWPVFLPRSRVFHPEPKARVKLEIPREKMAARVANNAFRPREEKRAQFIPNVNLNSAGEKLSSPSRGKVPRSLPKCHLFVTFLMNYQTNCDAFFSSIII